MRRTFALLLCVLLAAFPVGSLAGQREPFAAEHGGGLAATEQTADEADLVARANAER